MTPDSPDPLPGQRARVLVLSTTAFTLLFAVWLMLGMLGIPISKDLGLSDNQLYYLTLTAILAGALPRFNFGILADKYGGRKVMTGLLLATVVPTLLVSRATEYWHLLVCAALYGFAGNGFTVGIAWNAAWYPRARQGFALGVFGAGNVGASVTKLIGPPLILVIPAAGFFDGAVPGGWRFVPMLYAVLLVGMAAALWFGTPAADRAPGRGRPFKSVVAPLRHLRVWEFSLHYVVVFGAYVALSGVLPKYYYNNYGAELAASLGMNPQTAADFPTVKKLTGSEYQAYLSANPAVASDLKTLNVWIGWLAAVCYVFPASLLRPLGGWMSDKWGAKAITHAVFWAMILSGVVLSLPVGLGVWAFTAVLFVLGAGMGVGKASVYKMIPDYFPRDVGAVGGMVGMLGALGGVGLPLAWAAIPGSTFAAVLALTVASTAWFTVAELAARRPSPAAVEAEPVAAG